MSGRHHVVRNVLCRRLVSRRLCSRRLSAALDSGKFRCLRKFQHQKTRAWRLIPNFETIKFKFGRKVFIAEFSAKKAFRSVIWRQSTAEVNLSLPSFLCRFANCRNFEIVLALISFCLAGLSFRRVSARKLFNSILQTALLIFPEKFADPSRFVRPLVWAEVKAKFLRAKRPRRKKCSMICQSVRSC